MASPVKSVERQEGLWRNCADSVTHALEHFDPSQEYDPWHHRKWALLSVAHAAEVYCNLLLCVFDPKHPNNPSGRYPSLDGARKLLKSHPRLTESERYVIEEVLTPLALQRNTLMHMPAPEMLSVKDTAVALLSLLHIIRRRTGLDSSKFFQSSSIERDIFEEIDWHDYDAWYRVAERLVMFEYGQEGYIEACSNCGALAVPPEMRCQACFESDPG